MMGERIGMRIQEDDNEFLYMLCESYEILGSVFVVFELCFLLLASKAIIVVYLQ